MKNEQTQNTHPLYIWIIGGIVVLAILVFVVIMILVPATKGFRIFGHKPYAYYTIYHPSQQSTERIGRKVKEVVEYDTSKLMIDLSSRGTVSELQIEQMQKLLGGNGVIAVDNYSYSQTATITLNDDSLLSPCERKRLAKSLISTFGDYHWFGEDYTIREFREVCSE